MQEKKCPRCDYPKPISEFNKVDRYCKFHRSEINRNYRNKNRDKINEQCRNIRLKYKEDYEPVTEGTVFCFGCGQERPASEWSQNPYQKSKFRECCKICQNKKYEEARIAALSHYSSEPPVCAFCSEGEPKLLSFDHIDGGGRKHRKEISGRGANFLAWLKRNNYPGGFRVLCHSCNQIDNARKKRQDLLNLVSETTKVCKKCGTERFTAQFYEDERYDGGFRPVCRICIAEEYDDVRLECLRYYSNGDPLCVCCGKTEVEALCLDHLNGRSKELRAAMKNYPQYIWIKRNGFPEGLRVLCHSCNQARQYYGKCPHEKD